MASENSALWGSLVKAMTRKIEVPGFGTSTPPLRPEDVHDRRGGDRRGNERTEISLPRPEVTVASADKAIERIANHLSYLSRQTVEEYLESHGTPSGPLADRLRALGLAAGGSAGERFWWSVLSTGAADPETFAEVLRSCPGIPEHTDRGLLFDFVLDADVASYRDVKAAEKEAARSARRLTDVLVETEAIDADRAAELVASFYGFEQAAEALVPLATPGSTVTPELGRAFEIVPVQSTSTGLTLVSTSNPGPALLTTLQRMTGRDIEVVITTRDRLTALQESWEEALEEARRSAPQPAPTPKRSKARKAARDPRRGNGEFRIDQDSFAGINSPPEMARALMERATSVGATDIHLEPQRDGTRARFRLDGILYEVARLHDLMGEEVLSRIKVMADMDITERRKPQDGHIRLELHGEPYDFRIATVPTTHGERMSIRITAGSREVPTLDLLKLDTAEDQLLHDFTRRSHGIVLACGPVGSGKTTTLYACLGEIDAEQKNIMTIEDPVEIGLADVSQINVNYKIGLDFARGLRALLRQDPNIILVGEIRDEETAKVAVRASLTGLLVLSTIHANSAPGAITTLYNFNIPPFLLATSLVGIVAQRLLRTICPDCGEVIEPDPKKLEQAGITDEWLTTNGFAPLDGDGDDDTPKPRFARGRGCDGCFGTGYSGRRGIFEILDVTEEMRLAISERRPESVLREMALTNGMHTLADAGRRKVVEGVTTLEEFVRVLYQ